MDFQFSAATAEFRTKSVGERIRYYRTHHNISQAELGKKIGVGANTISNYETGKSAPSISHLNQFSLIFGVTLDDLAKNYSAADAGKPQYKGKEIPMLFRLFDVGTPQSTNEILQLPASMLKDPGASYVAWRANSDCLKGDQIEKDDLLLIRLTQRCENGVPIVATLCGMEIMGRYFEKEDAIFIFSNGSTDYCPYIIDKSNVDFTLFGTIEKVLKDM